MTAEQRGTMTDEEKVKLMWPEAKLLDTHSGRYEAYLAIHGDWQNSRELAWKSLADRLGERGLRPESRREPE